MNRDPERYPNSVVDETRYGWDVLARTAEQIQRWFRRPDPEQLNSLELALSGVREEFTSCRGVRFQIFVKGQPKTLQPEIREQIYLIGREALVNALRHSRATSIEAEVEYLPRRLRLVVRDNGCGIDQAAVRTANGNWGLLAMRDRAGSIRAQLRIWSRPGAGTEVEISVPDNIALHACA
jgi:signal transduction histidine kinase